MERRSFLKFSAAASALIASGKSPASQTKGEDPQIQRYVSLGDTDLKVSDVSFGTSRLTDESLVRYAFDQGVTYFDTAETYRGGLSESALGKALSSVRDKVVIASKTKARSNGNQKQFMTALEKSLWRLKTDYVDIYYNHAVNSVSRLQNPQWYEFTERALAQGKIRYRGVSGHGANLVECLDYALDNDLADVILVAFNFAHDPDFAEQIRHLFHYVALQPDLLRVLDKAHNQGVGVVAMKALMGARLNDMRAYETEGSTFAQAALKWVLSSSRVDAALISMTTTDNIREYIHASGKTGIAKSDIDLLTRYIAFQGSKYCQQGCRSCADSCAYNIDIPEVLRTRMYDVDYRDRQLALDSYASLQTDARKCLDCAVQSCVGACPNDIPIALHTQDAVRRLGLI